jgi:hypothetical protein
MRLGSLDGRLPGGPLGWRKLGTRMRCAAGGVWDGSVEIGSWDLVDGGTPWLMAGPTEGTEKRTLGSRPIAFWPLRRCLQKFGLKNKRSLISAFVKKNTHAAVQIVYMAQTLKNILHPQKQTPNPHQIPNFFHFVFNSLWCEKLGPREVLAHNLRSTLPPPASI